MTKVASSNPTQMTSIHIHIIDIYRYTYYRHISYPYHFNVLCTNNSDEIVFCEGAIYRGRMAIVRPRVLHTGVASLMSHLTTGPPCPNDPDYLPLKTYISIYVCIDMPEI